MQKKSLEQLLVSIFSMCFFVCCLLLACTAKKEIEGKNPEKFIFPVVIDTSDFDASHSYQFDRDCTWLSTSNYRLMYIGKPKDTIYAHYYYSFGPIDLPPGSELNEFNTKKQSSPLDGYYLEWLDEREYLSWEQADIEIQIDTKRKLNGSYPVLLLNKEKDTILISYGTHLPLIMEAKNKKGEWKPIEGRFTYMCGNGVESLILPSNEILITSAPIFKGDFETELRLVVGKNYSRPFKGRINYRQFESMFNGFGDYKIQYKNEHPEIQ